MNYCKEVTFSRHSLFKSSKRFNLHGQGRNESMIRHLLAHSLGADDLPYNERQWVLAKQRPGYEVRVCKDACMIISCDRVLVTVFRLPDWFSAVPVYRRKNNNRRAKILKNDFEYIQIYEDDDIFCA